MYSKLVNRITLIAILFVLFFPLKVLAANVLYISNSSLIQIGDNNRSYKVKLACIKVNPNKEDKAKEWLEFELPRKTKVNLLPKGVKDGMLVANVIKISSGDNINYEMIDKGFAIDACI